MNLSIRDSPLRLIGELKELLLQLKIKANVDHAGLLLLLLPMKVIKFNSKISQTPSVSVSNNSLTAPTSLPMRTMVAMVDMELELWNTSRISDRLPLLTILIPLRMNHALPKEDHTDLSALLKDMESLGVNFQQTEDDRPKAVSADAPLAGKTILFTGTLTKMGRKEAQAKAEAAGAKNISAVSGNLDYLVVGEDAGSKLKKAQALGTVTILTEDAFLDLVSG